MARRARLLSTLIAVLLVIGVSAAPAGVLFVIEPSGRLLGMSVETLRGTPFGDFRVPGLLLAMVVGLGAFFVAAALWWRPAWRGFERVNPVRGERWPWSAALLYGVGFLVWMGVEVVLLGPSSWLQAVCSAMGVAIVALPFAPSVRRALAARPP